MEDIFKLRVIYDIFTSFRLLFLSLILVFRSISFSSAEITADYIVQKMRESYVEQTKDIDDITIRIVSNNRDMSVQKKKVKIDNDAFFKSRIFISKNRGYWRMIYIYDGEYLWSIDRLWSFVEKQERPYNKDTIYFLNLAKPKLLDIDYLSGNKTYILEVQDIFKGFGTRRKKRWEKDLALTPAKIWVDAQRWIVLKINLSYNNKPISIHYDDYRNVSGLWIPYKTKYYIRDNYKEYLFLNEGVVELKINTGLSDIIFDASKEIKTMNIDAVYVRNPVTGSLSLQRYYKEN